METVSLAVNGTLMRGLELNHNLLDIGSTFVCETTTSPCYRLWSIDDRHPAMMRDVDQGRVISLEVWDVPLEGLATLLLGEPQGLCIGRITLIDGAEVLGVLGEPWLCQDQVEITDWGGWRAYMAKKGPC